MNSAKKRKSSEVREYSEYVTKLTDYTAFEARNRVGGIKIRYVG
jgi:hypothetical protein